MQSADLLELRDDLSRECSRLQTLVAGLSELSQRLDNSADAVEAAALRLHSFYTGVERMLLLISRVVNADITGFQCWLTSIAKETRANTPQRSDDTISQVDEALPQRPSGSRHRADLVSTTAQENQATSSDRG